MTKPTATIILIITALFAGWLLSIGISGRLEQLQQDQRHRAMVLQQLTTGGQEDRRTGGQER